MRVLHIATLFSTDGAYGGPTRVALNQCRALRERGHVVTIAGASAGYEDTPTELDGIPALLFPARRVVPRSGFAGLAAPGLLARLRTVRADFDVVHVHLARDLVTLPAIRMVQALGVPTVAQTHGMIGASGSSLAAPLDRLLTGPALRRAKAVLHLTETERWGLAATIPGELATVELPNGVPAAGSPPPHSPGAVEVLFLARLHERKRPELFVDVARDLLADGVHATFTVAGPDGGRRAAVEQAAAGTPVRVEGAIDPAAVSARLGLAGIYVLPSIDEPYPMSVLEAMAVGRPIVVTESCGLADVIRETGCGVVVDESKSRLKAAIGELIADPVRARDMGRRAAIVARERFSMDAIGERLESLYAPMVSPPMAADEVRP